MKTENIARLEEKIGYVFNDESHAKLALTHSSFANEKKNHPKTGEYNERLEFLGDSVLSVIVSDHLYKTYPDFPEGDLSRIRSGSVCEKALSRLARDIGLGEHLYLGKGEDQTNGRDRPSILADAFEALLAAVYLDGGIVPVRTFLLPRIIPIIEEIVSSGNDKDYKSLLQQVVQQERGDILEYVIVEESGPAHDKTFVTEARLNGNTVGRGEGKSKRSSEQNAACEALRLFGYETR